MTHSGVKKQLVGKLPRDVVIAPVVKVQVQLIAADHIIKGTCKPNRNRPGASPFAKVADADYQRLIEYAKEAVWGCMDYLYYTDSHEPTKVHR